ncbi:IDEAL domain-containing protein [Salimicrobium halophilum]|uniref:IDEAL domain-containing protein n=1 Tax=Salimicrobium halophilum TaxID=86666 RepID=A0A1G8S1S0_9BACI|nr:IDEAL domain-containing protein [Salimicrobium halophilum]SDJ23146.1 IDEAL domain-containing protein [Salimicrobium halophilum]
MMQLEHLQPYAIVDDGPFLRIIFDHSYVRLNVDEETYQFIPSESSEIFINKDLNKVHNLFDVFTFESGEEVLHMTVIDLMHIKQFRSELHQIIHSFYEKRTTIPATEVTTIIEELEKENIHRLIDEAIDKGDEASFLELTNRLTEYGGTVEEQ